MIILVTKIINAVFTHFLTKRREKDTKLVVDKEEAQKLYMQAQSTLEVAEVKSMFADLKLSIAETATKKDIQRLEEKIDKNTKRLDDWIQGK